MRLEEALELTGGSFKIVDGKCVVENSEGIGLAHIPVDDAALKPILIGKIFDFYRMHEIGFETISTFAYHMRVRLNQVMPEFNKLYALEKIEIDPLSTMDYRTETVTQSDVSSERVDNVSTENNVEEISSAASNVESQSTGQAVSTVFPQQEISVAGKYASDGSETKSVSDSETTTGTTGTREDSTTSSATGTDTAETSSDSDSHTHGYQGHTAELVARYRDTIINVDDMLVNSLSDLFMGVWSNNQPYTSQSFYTPLFLTHYI